MLRLMDSGSLDPSGDEFTHVVLHRLEMLYGCSESDRAALAFMRTFVQTLRDAAGEPRRLAEGTATVGLLNKLEICFTKWYSPGALSNELLRFFVACRLDRARDMQACAKSLQSICRAALPTV